MTWLIVLGAVTVALVLTLGVLNTWFSWSYRTAVVRRLKDMEETFTWHMREFHGGAVPLNMYARTRPRPGKRNGG